MTSPRNHANTGVKFLIVGGLAFVVDAGIYNILVFWGNDGPFFNAPILAKIISLSFGSVFSYFGNKFFTYNQFAKKATVREFVLFNVVNGLGIVIQLSFLGFSRYVLHLDDPVADNLWGTIFGQIAAMLFRYFGYGKWVFGRGAPTDS